ncbi:hypothetical protein HAX54_040836, partial [Datura stramonium]|nr:hypothetical protein [Datura stramonium]
GLKSCFAEKIMHFAANPWAALSKVRAEFWSMFGPSTDQSLFCDPRLEFSIRGPHFQGAGPVLVHGSQQVDSASGLSHTSNGPNHSLSDE